MPGWRRFICRKGELSLAGAVLLAAACVLAAVGMRMLLGLIGITLTFPTFYPAVLLAALIGGRIAGLLSIANPASTRITNGYRSWSPTW